MKIGVILLCRYNSSRLPGKILREINGKPLIAYILERLLAVVDRSQIVVTTSESSSDDRIVAYCSQNNIQYFRGSLDNVSGRFLNCALQHDFDYAVRINGDNLFAEMNVLAELLELAKNGEHDLLVNTKDKTFPQGMSVEVVRTKFYQEQYKNFASDLDFEHVTWYFHQNPEVGKRFYLYNEKCPEAQGLKFAIDDENDFALAEKIIARMQGNQTQYNIKEIYGIYKTLENERVEG